MIRFIALISIILSFNALLKAQEEERDILLSGLVMRLDSVIPIPSANIFIKHSRIGVRSSEIGLFSIAVANGDTIVFSAVGSKTTFYIVPDNLNAGSYSIIQRMPLDTISLETIEISAWPSIEQFNKAFTEEKGYDEEYQAADFNANPILINLTFEAQKPAASNRYSNLYENAHIPLKDVLNPKRWEKLTRYWGGGN